MVTASVSWTECAVTVTRTSVHMALVLSGFMLLWYGHSAAPAPMVAEVLSYGTETGSEEDRDKDSG